MNSEKKINVYLADDHHIFRAGIRVLLEQEADLQVIGEASFGEEVLHDLRHLPVDVLLLDIDMPGMNGLELIKQLNRDYPQLKVLVFSLHDNDHYVHHMLTNGARGYILKSCRKDELIRAIATVYSGDSYLAKEVSQKLIRSVAGKEIGENDDPLPLSEREIEVLRLVATGRTSQEIAPILHISPRTVDTHRRNIMEKLDLHNAAALTNYAARKGLLK
jgi:DNA-binding NarL/FixJ family response regulator